jgi:thioredoxin
MKFRSVFFVITAFIFFSCKGQTSKEINTIDPISFSEKINTTKDAQILDVRTSEEFASEHINNATNVNWLADDFVLNTEKFDKSKPVFVYCKAGGRSLKASEKLKELGFKTVYNLDGGILKWNSAGLSKPTGKITGMSSQEYNQLLNTDKKVLVNFYAEWCAPCKKMAPFMTKMQTEIADKVVIIRLNADEHKTLMSTMKIDELPTLLLYENKEVKWRNSGYISEEDLKKQL